MRNKNYLRLIFSLFFFYPRFFCVGEISRGDPFSMRWTETVMLKLRFEVPEVEGSRGRGKGGDERDGDGSK